MKAQTPQLASVGPRRWRRYRRPRRSDARREAASAGRAATPGRGTARRRCRPNGAGRGACRASSDHSVARTADGVRTTPRIWAEGSSPASARSASSMMRTRPANVTVGPPAEDARRLRGVAAELVHLGRAEVALVDPDVALPVEAGEAEGDLDELAAPSASRRSRSRSRPARPAGASATSPRRTPGHSPSRAGRPGCPCRGAARSPARIAAMPRVTLRVTNVPPRRGDSWLNRIPLEACIP